MLCQVKCQSQKGRYHDSTYMRYLKESKSWKHDRMVAAGERGGEKGESFNGYKITVMQYE